MGRSVAIMTKCSVSPFPLLESRTKIHLRLSGELKKNQKGILASSFKQSFKIQILNKNELQEVLFLFSVSIEYDAQAAHRL